jgi:hypothetical protein
LRAWTIFLLAWCGAICCDSIATDERSEERPEERQHWSLRPRVRPDVPTFAEAAGRDWIRTPIDAFILDRLRQEGLQPAPEADRRTLIRRLSFNLTGLPPTPAEVASFLDDAAPDAWERLVDRFLESPQYGERWGQHWLDVVRFAESEGFEYDRPIPGAWRFRDYVIESFNADKPFDRFLLEQLAGDELSEQDDSLTERDRRELQVAAGFHRLGPVRRNAGNPDVALSRNEVLTERTDIIGSALLGLTVGCARCHDHFFDPIPQKDYYRLQAFLAATYEYDIPLADEATRTRWQSQTEALQAEIKRLKTEIEQAADDSEQQRLQEQIRALEDKLPEPLPTIASVRNVPQERTPIYVLTRGDPDLQCEQVGMRVLTALLPDRRPEFPADTAGPKTIVARWLIEPDHPMTARVLANRIWLAHFGAGLVDTPNDFGWYGNPPSHPELLDWLADELVVGGWRLKRLHRLVLTSSAWRQSSHSLMELQGREGDPENRLLWRFNRRRLSAEEIRDAVLAVSGTLNPKMGGPSVLVPADPELVNLLYAPSQWQITPDASEHNRRSVYLMAKRNLRLPLLEVFDQPDLLTSCGRRESSTHAPQALELLNGVFANQAAEQFAARLLREAGPAQAAQVDLAFRLATGRPPSPAQQQAALEFLADQPLREFALALFNLNAFLYVD